MELQQHLKIWMTKVRPTMDVEDEEVCELCGKSDLVNSDDRDSENDDPSIKDNTLEYEWETCEICHRLYHSSCLMRSVGTEKCIYCGFE